MFDIFLIEAVINGVLLGGVLALLALGLNLVFGVIDVVWICYAELVMIGMYAIWWLFVHYGVPLPVAIGAAVALVALAGVALHVLVIQPVLGTPPINQLLVTGGVLFFLQAAATWPSASSSAISGCACRSSRSARCSSASPASSPSPPRSRASPRCGCSSRAPIWARRSARSARTARSCR